MGIQYLQSYIHSNGAKVRCNMADLIKQEAKRNHSTPILVIDVKNCARIFCNHNDKHVNLYGGQFQEIEHNITTLVNNISKAGGKTVAYYDSVHDLDEERLQQWTQKQSQKMSKVKNTFKALENGNLKYIEFMLSAAQDLCIQSAFRCLPNCELRYSLTDCDQDMVQYIRDNQCFALLSNDTDFMAFDVADFYLLSPQDLDLATLDTVYYDRNKLRNILNLKQKQMPLFASLSGNDIIPRDKLKIFHQKICINNDKLFNDIARFINTNNFVDLTDVNIANVAKYAEINQERLEESLEIYKCQKMVKKLPHGDGDERALMDMIYKKHQTAETTPRLFEFLYDKEIFSSINIEKIDSNKIHNWLLPLRQRIYRIIYNNINQQITEYEITPNNVIKTNVAPYLGSDIPSFRLLDVWNDEQLKWITFAGCVSTKINVSDLKKLKIHFVIPVLALYYIRIRQDGPLMTKPEIIIFLKHIVQGKSETPKRFFKNINPRAVDLAAKFHSICAELCFLSAVCGNCVPLDQCSPAKYFNGKLFYQGYMNGNIRLNGREDEDYKSLASFVF